MKHAPLAIVVCADQTKSDAWVEDCSIAAVLLQTVAESLGLGSCWIQIRNRSHDGKATAQAFIQDLLGLPEQVKVASIISIGHPGESKPRIPTGELEYTKVKYNRYSETW